MVIISQGHGGTPTLRSKHRYLTCDCGLEFPVYKHPVEPDEFESPGWVAHVLQMRREDGEPPVRASAVKVVGEGDGWVLR